MATLSSQRPLAAVTGASSGIGFELAKQFAQAGFDLVIAAEDVAIEQAAREIAPLGVNVVPVQTDLATYQGVETLCGAIGLQTNALEAIAINAGVGVGGPFVDTDLKAELPTIHPVGDGEQRKM